MAEQQSLKIRELTDRIAIEADIMCSSFEYALKAVREFAEALDEIADVHSEEHPDE